MRHLTAVHVDLPEGSGWHYATLSKRGGYPMGYCREHPPHETESEARKCYQQYLRDHVELRAEASSWTDCSIREPKCKNPANNVAQYGPYGMAWLCVDHFNMTDAMTALRLDEEEAGDAWES